MTTTTLDPQLDLSAGSYIKGAKLDENTFLATTSFQQLRTITRDPEFLQPGSRKGDDVPTIGDERAIHELIQGALAGNKKTNAVRFQRYIEDLVRERATGTLAPKVLPPMHLWSPAALDIHTVGPTTYILVPNGETLFAIDGETQLTAHHALYRSGSVDPGVRRDHLKLPLGSVLHHGVPVGIARQYFHDLNILAVRPNTSLGLSMDTQDPIMKVVGDVEAGVPLLAGRVDKMARQLPRKSDKLVTLQSLRQMVIDVAKGTTAPNTEPAPHPSTAWTFASSPPWRSRGSAPTSNASRTRLPIGKPAWPAPGPCLPPSGRWATASSRRPSTCATGTPTTCSPRSARSTGPRATTGWGSPATTPRPGYSASRGPRRSPTPSTTHWQTPTTRASTKCAA